jgi:Skp family chaperone for outer membrane proteins
MRISVKAAAAIIAAASLFGSTINASDATPPKKRAAAKAKTPPPPSVADQIEALRQQMQSQIDGLKTDLQTKDQQLQQANQAAAAAQAAAARAQAAADAEQTAINQNQTAVSTLSSTVDDVKNAQALAVGDLSDQTQAIRKSMANPDAINYKGITLSPNGSFLAAETVWRSGATGSDINTAMTGIPLQYSEGAQLSEFYAAARQSRIALKATGKVGDVTATGYYEADFLSSGTTSNNNQSNSYTLRQRELWADAKLASGWDFSGGTGWSLSTENTSAMTRGTQITPATIDAQYTAGFVWARQESFRVSKNIGKKVFLGVAAENPQTLNPGGSGLPLNVLIGSGGTSGGLYNAAANPTTGTALANYTFNYSPDLIAKLVLEPGWGHWEVLGIQRTFRDRIYPNLSCTSVTTAENNTGTGTITIPAITTCAVINAALAGTAGAFNDKELGLGIGGSVRGPVLNKKITIGLKGLWGQGVGRYGNSTIADVTIRPSGLLSPIHSFSGLGTVEVNPNPKLNVYFNYGGDYLARDYALNSSGSQVGYGARSAAMSTCNVEPNPGNGGQNQSADPTGAGGSCAGNNKDVQEFTAGYWFYFFNNTHGRLRQGIQYSNIRRDLWSGATSAANPGAGAHGIDNMIFTSFRYYLP